MSQVRDDLKTIVADNCPKVRLTDESDCDRPLKDLGIDSLDVMSILLAVQERHGVEIPDQDVDDLTTLNAIAGYVERRIGQGPVS